MRASPPCNCNIVICNLYSVIIMCNCNWKHIMHHSLQGSLFRSALGQQSQYQLDVFIHLRIKKSKQRDRQTERDRYRYRGRQIEREKLPSEISREGTAANSLEIGALFFGGSGLRVPSIAEDGDHGHWKLVHRVPLKLVDPGVTCQTVPHRNKGLEQDALSNWKPVELLQQVC